MRLPALAVTAEVVFGEDFEPEWASCEEEKPAELILVTFGWSAVIACGPPPMPGLTSSAGEDGAADGYEVPCDEWTIDPDGCEGLGADDGDGLNWFG